MPRLDLKTCRGLLGLLAESSVHAGTGQQLGAVDLPVQRERHTDWPTIYGSGLKGVLRDHAKDDSAKFNGQEIEAVFGPDSDKGNNGEQNRFAGALAISDARLLLFPVRTLGKAFAWITCPMAWARLERDAADAGLPNFPNMDTKNLPNPEKVQVPSKWIAPAILLEEFEYMTFQYKKVDELAEWIGKYLLPQDAVYAYWRTLLAESLTIVCDDDFRDFTRQATEIVTRIKISSDTKTVADHMLWTEENLPADSLLYSLVVAWPPAKGSDSGLADANSVMEKFSNLIENCGVIQVGGKETVGRGFMAVRLTGGIHGQTA